MDFERAKAYLLSKPQTELDFPFGEGVYVFKVKGKMFATLSVGKMGKEAETKPASELPSWWMNLKCDPDEAAILRDIFPSVIPGYHMNKSLWNTVILDGSIPQGEIERMIDNSFLLVVAKMTKKDQQFIGVQI
ncbi:MmcQ/YjbR family DNA-binding protein [Shewanella canadensis]|uniref:MmcQ/YjbR family DNA-binding protein n=1 Tax=Shewanella canadensis TaxID=271096 RepID=A0A431WQQ7_9GAMM|nr:MmcQ/YjbR family DNA-binding protein [Shewanella canadensis]RTR37519.1 MmcQ/YjbR family DNA-binding protein [Shewanella canadensis]